MIENLCSGTKRSATPYRNVLVGRLGFGQSNLYLPKIRFKKLLEL